VNYLIHLALGYGVPIALIYLLSRRRQGNEWFQRGSRLLLTIMMVGVIVLLIPEIQGYVDLVRRTTQSSRAMSAAPAKMSAAELASTFARAQRIPPNADFRCRPADRDWDYVCSYMPTPSQSKTRVELGFAVDSKRWIKASGIVPEGTTIPPPR
jgi:hypothetical protein